MHTKSTLYSKNNLNYPKVGYIKHLHQSVWKVFIRRHYLDKLKIEKNFESAEAIVAAILL